MFMNHLLGCTHWGIWCQQKREFTQKELKVASTEFVDVKEPKLRFAASKEGKLKKVWEHCIPLMLIKAYYFPGNGITKCILPRQTN